MLLVSLTQVANFAAGINDTSGIGGKFAPVLLILVANLPLVLLIPVVLLDLQISKYLRNFFKKFKMTLMLLPEAWGKMIYEKTRSK